MPLRILNLQLLGKTVEVTVPSKEDAEYLAAQVKNAGFEDVCVGQPLGFNETIAKQVRIQPKKGGSEVEIITFIKGRSDIKFDK